jgi:hypothetical protein
VGPRPVAPVYRMPANRQVTLSVQARACAPLAQSWPSDLAQTACKWQFRVRSCVRPHEQTGSAGARALVRCLVRRTSVSRQRPQRFEFRSTHSPGFQVIGRFVVAIASPQAGDRWLWKAVWARSWVRARRTLSVTIVTRALRLKGGGELSPKRHQSGRVIPRCGRSGRKNSDRNLRDAWKPSPSGSGPTTSDRSAGSASLRPSGSSAGSAPP